ncbi:CPXCG motif-containing cysteine-rich protein [Aliikangiella sp. G2MR2-5]|uniref:CPXCG motif-containing cysteine-rich protein n=1 Tax=Aliikangiella sp. G2MR2-5 TaxID=2788943 RepID=UPI0018A88C45|nr:CPXCG motif-containing cysteine-rich protein [Aliikangiella sp. G2MR2-5]
MNPVEYHNIQCPYCWESLEISIDISNFGVEEAASSINFIEDCQICCQPIAIDVSIGFDEKLILQARKENL